MAAIKGQIMSKQMKSSLYCPIRNYIVYYNPTEVDNEAAEANPAKYFLSGFNYPRNDWASKNDEAYSNWTKEIL